MPVVNCPNGHRIQVTDRHIGQNVTCPTCQTSFVASSEEQPFDFGNSEKSGAAPQAVNAPRGSYVASLINSFVGKPLLFIGLALVILGRGCDATGLRSVARTNAQYQQAKTTFMLEWEGKTSAAQQLVDKKIREINDLMDKKNPAGEELFKRQKALQEERFDLEKKVNALRSDQNAARSEKENGDWKPYREAALSAGNHHRMWVYWYELLFIFGTIVLVFGILTLAFTGQGAERWVAYIMIAIITFSVYVGGAAWIESIVTSSTSGGGAPPIIP